jgi:hypothetical protein
LDCPITIDTPGTNQLARLILKRIGRIARDTVICRHQLFFVPRVPYTSKNGSASIQLPHADAGDMNHLVKTIREVMQGWFVEGSDPRFCVAESVSEEMTAFGLRCKKEVVSQDEARVIAGCAGCHLEGLGGTKQGMIGALAAVGLIASGDDGRVVQLSTWPYPNDAFSGPQEINDILSRGIDEIRNLKSGERVTRGMVNIGKRLRPNWRGGRVVLYVNPATDPPAVSSWNAVKLP